MNLICNSNINIRKELSTSTAELAMVSAMIMDSAKLRKSRYENFAMELTASAWNDRIAA